MKSLKVSSVTKYARATDHIKEIQSQTKRLIEKGYGYKIEDGIYYDISKFKDYGKLSGRTMIMAEDAISRIDETKGKRNRGDFCLWKFSKPEEPKWKSPFGWGRPGWHIEDTAIAEKYFGFQYDVHGGAKDLIFPHHEAEISQMEAISGKKPMVKYWLHTGFLTVKGEKMAKSLGNFITIRDFLKSLGSQADRILRFFVLKNHYRSPIDYSEKTISQTEKEIERIDEFVEKLKRSDFPRRSDLKKIETSKFQREFELAMDDDFNTPKAIALVFNLINKGNSLIAQDKLTSLEAKNILNLLREIDKIFNFIFWEKPKEKISQNVLKLVEEREKFRKEKSWKKADEIRQKIKKLGYKIEDTGKGPKVKKN
jgi:cysteinyl-tRNA synthetase